LRVTMKVFFPFFFFHKILLLKKKCSGDGDPIVEGGFWFLANSMFTVYYTDSVTPYHSEQSKWLVAVWLGVTQTRMCKRINIIVKLQPSLSPDTVYFELRLIKRINN